jgi:diguanylate cyclase (GGDEF)-like protein
MTPSICAVITGIVVLLVGAISLHNIAENHITQYKMQAMEQSLFIKEKVIRFVASNNTALQSLRSVILQKTPVSEAEFRQISQSIFRKHDYIKYISLAPAGVIHRVYPLGLNKNLLNVRIPRKVIHNIAQSKDNLAIVVEVKHNQLFKFSLHSLLLPDELGSLNNGIVSLELDLKQFLKMEVLANDALVLPFTLLDQQSLQSLLDLSGELFLDDNNTFLTSVDVGENTWQIKTLIKGKQRFVGLGWLVTIILSLLLSAMSYKFLSVYRQRSEDVKAGAYRANYDLLTGLPNRYHFSRRLRETIAESKREQNDFAIFFMDIDHFKHMNDQLGQGAGDTILTTFAHRLERAVKHNDLIARISGDEFVIVARDVDDAIKADLLAEKLKKNLQQPIDFLGQQHFVSVSIGVAMYPIDGDDVPSLLHRADQAMYAAKRAGRNRHVFFNESMREQADIYLQMNEDILRGLEQGEFELYYQPVVNVKTSMVDICEALIRWNHPHKGLVLPDMFIPLAERTGAIREIGHWAFAQACRDIRIFSDGDIKVKIAINHSMSEYYSNRALERWKKALNENNVSGDNFIFEIPEILLMDKKSIRMSVVTAMRKLGVQFAIDDFGTGHSAINYLRNYPADILKIDSSLIHGMLTNEKDRTLVDVVMILAKSLGKKVVAEGVESNEMASLLKEMNCDYLQGHWLFEPKPIGKLIPYLHIHMYELEDQDEFD